MQQFILLIPSKRPWLQHLWKSFQDDRGLLLRRNIFVLVLLDGAIFELFIIPKRCDKESYLLPSEHSYSLSQLRLDRYRWDEFCFQGHVHVQSWSSQYHSTWKIFDSGFSSGMTQFKFADCLDSFDSTEYFVRPRRNR